MHVSGHPQPPSSRPCVVMLDPLTWAGEWSYDVEREMLADEGIELIVPVDEEHQTAVAATADVIVSSGRAPVGADRINTFKRCVGIVCYDAGTDAVDARAAQAAGLPVTGVHADCSDAADHAMALVLAAHRPIVPVSRATVGAEWDARGRRATTTNRRLSSVKIGILGTGPVAREVEVRARSFGMDTTSVTHTGPPHTALSPSERELHDLMRRSDVIVVTSEATPDPGRVIDAAALEHVRRGTVLVNLGSARLVDEHAVARALDDGRLRAVGLDVRQSESANSHDPLAGRQDVLPTPRVVGLPREADGEFHRRAAITAIDILWSADRLGGTCRADPTPLVAAALSHCR